MQYLCGSREQSSEQWYPLLLLGFASEGSVTPAYYRTLSSGGWTTHPSWPYQSLGCWSKPLLLPLAVFFPFSQLLPVVYCLLALRPSFVEEIQAGFGAGVFFRAEFRSSRLSAFMESCSSRDEGRQQGCRAGPAVSWAQTQLPSSHSCQLYFKLPGVLASFFLPKVFSYCCFT